MCVLLINAKHVNIFVLHNCIQSIIIAYLFGDFLNCFLFSKIIVDGDLSDKLAHMALELKATNRTDRPKQISFPPSCQPWSGDPTVPRPVLSPAATRAHLGNLRGDHRVLFPCHLSAEMDETTKHQTGVRGVGPG